MRLFVALDVDDNIRGHVAPFVEGVRGFAPEARWVRTDSLHVTLKFIGERPEEEVESIKRTLGTIRASALEMKFIGYGFFPSPRKPKLFWAGIESDSTLASLSAKVDESLASLHIPREERAFAPHLTLARAAGRATAPHRTKESHPASGLRHLQKKLADRATPEFGTMTAREFFLYQSQPSAGGSRYTKLARFALPGAG